MLVPSCTLTLVSNQSKADDPAVLLTVPMQIYLAVDGTLAKLSGILTPLVLIFKELRSSVSAMAQYLPGS